MRELEIPITKELTTNVAVRDDHFSDFGNTINPKASFRYQPNQKVMFRGSANTGFQTHQLCFDRYGIVCRCDYDDWCSVG